METESCMTIAVTQRKGSLTRIALDSGEVLCGRLVRESRSQAALLDGAGRKLASRALRRAPAPFRNNSPPPASQFLAIECQTSDFLSDARNLGLCVKSPF